MATRSEKIQNFIRYFREKTGDPDIDMRDVATEAKRLGWKMPIPKSDIDILAKEFSTVAREEIRHDEVTKRPYRAQHCFVADSDGKQRHLWLDIDGVAPRHKMLKALSGRLRQMVGDGVQIRYDEDHWNRIHPNEEPIQLDLDLNEPVEWAINAPQDRKKRAS